MGNEIFIFCFYSLVVGKKKKKKKARHKLAVFASSVV